MKFYINNFSYKKDFKDVVNLDLRTSDVEEVRDFTGESPRETLEKLIEVNDVMYLIQDKYKRTLGVFGLVGNEAIPEAAEIFFLASKELEDSLGYSFIKQSARTLKTLIRIYEKKFIHFYNYVSSKNKKSIKWLKWLGFKVYEESPIFFNNKEVPFYFFKLERS